MLEAGNIEIKAENTRLRAELKAKIEELESRVDVTTENAKLKELRSWNRISVNHKLKWLTMKLSPLLPSCVSKKTIKDRETDEFLDSEHKKK